MKRLITITLSLLTFMTTMAQGIAFEPDGTTLEQASAKAKAENKMIFLDCYTTWCGPCRMMARTVFTQEKVGSAMNPKFISVKIDMESEYGAPLAKKLQVTAYPTFVIFNADLQEVGRFLGGSEADEFLKKVKEKGSDNSSVALKARWDSGDRDPQFLQTYLKTLTATYKTQDANDVAEALLAGKEETFASDSTLRRIFISNINNPFAKSFVYTAKNPDALASHIGARGVEAKVNNVLSGYQQRLIIEKDGSASLDKAQFDAFISLLAELKTKEADHYRLSTLITLAEKQKDYKSYITYIKEYLANKSLDASDMQLAQWTKPFSTPDADPKQKAEIKKILQKRIKDIESGKRQPQTQVGNMRLSRPTDDLLRMIVDALDGKMPQQH
ncbi:MAG: thioredoxin family protein [Bacteroidaceae bacterium]|nr:thioredoxin family protein [Bacteroidaceae bacterium]